MKKIISLLFTLTIIFSFAFADKKRFYENGKVIDTMYVDSVDGLKVRDCPSLKSNRICGLKHRFPVKVVAIGKEESIDGITAPWVEILIPSYEWKSGSPEYGWVFGGYLSKEIPLFVQPKNSNQLKSYLEYSYFNFGFENGGSAFDCFGYIENNIAHVFPDGWAIGKEVKVKFAALKSDCINIGKFLDYYINEGNYKIDRIMENEFICYQTYPYSLYASQHFFLKINDSFLIEMAKNKRAYAVIDNLNILQTLAKSNYSNSNVILKFIAIGISADKTPYEKQYHDYWNPIMAEHQKKADANGGLFFLFLDGTFSRSTILLLG